MPAGVGFDLVVAGFLVALLAAAALVARFQKERGATVEAVASSGEESGDHSEGISTAALESGAPTEEEWGRFEGALIQARVGPRAARRLVTRMRDRLRPGRDPDDLLVDEVAEIFRDDPPLSLPNRMAVLMIAGPAGSGKTTTAGKLAHRLVNQGRLVALAACGTPSTVAAHQLAAWAEGAGAEVLAPDDETDAGAMSYGAVEWARARGSDVLIVDASVQAQTLKQELEELARIKRVLEKAAGRVDEVLLCFDATTNGGDLPMAGSFIDAAGVTGIAVTKLDRARSRGIVVALRGELEVPVKLVGTGEGMGDLRAFDAGWFARAFVSG